MMHHILKIPVIMVLLSILACTEPADMDSRTLKSPVLDEGTYKHYIKEFNALDEQAVVNYIPNAGVMDWLKENIPVFECPDKELEKIYYYRWWSLRKHIKETPDGFVFTEFITPVKHAGKYNTISCALGHHISEARWLHDPAYLDQYILFWYRKNKGGPQPHFHQYSNWATDAVYKKFLVNGDTTFVLNLLDDFVADYRQWETEKQLDSGLFWQFDVRDGMEESISGSRRQHNARPTINSYMYANALAISRVAAMAGKGDLDKEYAGKAALIRTLVHKNLWDAHDHFFKVMFENGALSDAREEIGFIPWMFGLADDSVQYGEAWQQILDEQGFSAPWGITTAERRHPQFRSHGAGSCEWDGAVWPFATSQTLNGLANLLHDYTQHSMTKQDYLNALLKYARSHQKNGAPYIGEYQDETNGTWLKGDNPRSIYYNHSTFCDLIISGLVGLKPANGPTVKIDPLVPQKEWDWFCLDNVTYHNHVLTIIWDKTGKKYGKGRGFSVFADGRLLERSQNLKTTSVGL